MITALSPWASNLGWRVYYERSEVQNYTADDENIVSPNCQKYIYIYLVYIYILPSDS